MSSKEFSAQIFAWLNHVKADHEMPCSAFLVAFELCQHFNEDKDGEAWPGCNTIAKAIGKSEATVIAMVRLLSQRGHHRVDWGKPGRGYSNHYRMILKPEALEARKTSAG
jgi:hypothetical protein